MTGRTARHRSHLWRDVQPTALPFGGERVFLFFLALTVLIIVAYEGADLAGVPWPLNSQEVAPLALALIPMCYVLRGLEPAGAALMAAWILLLTLLDVVLTRRGAGPWADDMQVAIIGSVALFVGYRVRQETRLRRCAEESRRALQVSEARYRALFDQSQTAILVTDAGRVVREVNAAAAALFGQPNGAPVGRALDDYFGSEVAGRILDGGVPLSSATPLLAARKSACDRPAPPSTAAFGRSSCRM